LCDAETWTLRKVDRKYPESFEMWCWRTMEKISWTDHVRNEEVLQRVREERNILHTVKRRRANWIGHIVRRNCRLKHVIQGKIEERVEMTGRRGRRCKLPLGDHKERRRYCELKAEAIDGTVWRTRFGRGYRPVVTRLRSDDDSSAKLQHVRNVEWGKRSLFRNCLCFCYVFWYL
jgi:hypothetical protein